MALQFYNKIFFHIPKTGGSYVRYILRINFSDCKEIGNPIESWQIQSHSRPFEITMDEFKQNIKFCTIRHPINWYKSHYRYRVKTGWRDNFPLDIMCHSETFQGFIENVLEKWSTYVTELYENYVPYCDYYIYQEQLESQLTKLLQSWNYTIITKPVLINDTSRDIDTTLDPKLEEKILQAEQHVIQKYYPSYENK